MPEINIRPAISSDINEIIQFDHAVETSRVMQIERSKELEDFRVTFRETRLPRSVQVRYPRPPNDLKDEWQKKAVILVALLRSQLVGYTAIEVVGMNTVAWITDLVVNMPFRRKGIGSALLLAAQNWSERHKISKMILEVLPKNEAGINLARKAGLEFCGFNDYYFPNQEVALFLDAILKDNFDHV